MSIKIGLNMEYVRHADKSLAYGIKRAGEIGYKYVEPCFLMGRCLISNGGYCHVTSLDTDPAQVKDMVDQAGVQISALSTHSDQPIPRGCHRALVPRLLWTARTISPGVEIV